MIDGESLKGLIADVARRNGARKAILFGSWARGTATARSDVDVIFVEETGERFLARLDRYLGPLQGRVPAGIEAFVYTPEELSRISWKPFIRKALAEGIVVYESGETAR